MSNKVLEPIQQVLGNPVNSYNINKTSVEKDDPCSGILRATSFVICLTENGLKYHSPGKLVFGHDMILLINHKMDLELLLHQKQT